MHTGLDCELEAHERLIPETIHLIWLGSEPSQTLLSTLEAFRRLNPGWTVQLWRDGDLDWLDNQPLFDSAPTYAARSNIARYEIVHKYGGYYFDADFEPLLTLEDNLPRVGLVVTPERRGYYNQAFFGAPAGHGFLGQLIKELPDSVSNNPSASSQTTSGPAFFTRELETWRRRTKEPITELPRDILYPYSFDKLSRSGGPWAPGVIAVHRWDQARKPRVYVDGRSVRSHSARSRLRSALRPRARGQAALKVARRLTWKPQALPIDDLRAITITRDGTPLIFNKTDLNTLGYLYSSGEYDSGFRKFLRRVLSGSDVYVDVGANIGQFVVAAAQQLSEYGRVFAFEPNALVADTLFRNVYLQRNSGRIAAEVDVRQIAISDHVGSISLRVPTMHDGRASTSPEALSDLPESTIEVHEVEVSTLDTQLGFLSHIRLLKIDVEGVEPYVIDGAQLLINSGRVDFMDIESVRAHLGQDIEMLARQLDNLQSRGATVFELSANGTPVPIGGRAGEAIRSRDFGHLIVDLRVLRKASKVLQ